MRTAPVTLDDFRGVFPVPPLARQGDGPSYAIDFDQSERILRHIEAGGITRFLYGGNAFLYHITLADYEALLDWMAGRPDAWWMIPSAGPSYGRALDQARLLRRHRFPCVMMLPCSDPRDAAGLERGLREIADAADTPLLLYLKEEHNFGTDPGAGLDAVARLVDDGVCVGIKYAVVRENPAEDAYLDALLQRVDRRRVISGIGERPAVVHLRTWGLPGFTTGSGCVQPLLCQRLLDACQQEDDETAETLRAHFMPLEDRRDAWGPSRVLHAAVGLAGIADTGPVLPFLSPLSQTQHEQLAPVAQALAEQHQASSALR